MRGALIRIGRWLGALGGIILVLNLEAVLTALGLDDAATNPKVLRAALAVIQSPITLAAALIFFGFGLFAALDWVARKWDATHPTTDQRLCDMWPDMYDLSETIGRDINNGMAVASMGLASRISAKYITLRNLGLECPEIGDPWVYGRYWLGRNKLFLDLIVPILREGHAQDARINAANHVAGVAEHQEELKQRIERQIAAGQGVALPTG